MMIYKVLLVFLVFSLHTTLMSMQANLHIKLKKNNQSFFTFFDQKVKSGMYTQDKKEKEKYYSKKQKENLKIETIIDTRETIQGLKELSFLESHFLPNFSVELLFPIATIQYTITHSLCIIIVQIVEDKFQRKGFGSLLLSDLEQEMREYGCKKISLTAINEYSEAFYRKNGFVKKNQYGRMNKKLNKPNL